MSRVAIYVRVSTTGQSVANQQNELEAWAARAGHTVVKVYKDHGISGTKGRDGRPGFRAVLDAASRREYETLAVWSTDRLGRSLQDLVAALNQLRGAGRDLYIHTQALDTSTPSGRALFGMMSVFAEFEREMIVERVKAGLARAEKNGTRSGKAIGRPKIHDGRREKIVTGLVAGGLSVRGAAQKFDVGVGTVAKIRAELVAQGRLE